MFAAFREAICVLAGAGCDLLLLETFRYVGELEIVIEANCLVGLQRIQQVTEFISCPR